MPSKKPLDFKGASQAPEERPSDPKAELLDWLADSRFFVEPPEPVDLLGSDVPPGLYPIVGTTGAGKTRFLEFIAARIAAPVFVINEPFSPPHPASPSIVRHFLRPVEVEELVACVARAAKEDRERIILVDSLRSWLWAKGAAGSRGLDANLGTRLTFLSNYAASKRIVLLATLNPSYRDPEFVSRVTDVALESTVGTFELDGWQDDRPVGAFTVRPERVSRPIESCFTFGAKVGTPSQPSAPVPSLDPESDEFLFIDILEDN